MLRYVFWASFKLAIPYTMRGRIKKCMRTKNSRFMIFVTIGLVNSRKILLHNLILEETLMQDVPALVSELTYYRHFQSSLGLAS